MNKHQAEKLIKELFANEFDIDRYQYFLRNLFNKYVKRHKHYIGAYIPDAFKLHIHQYWRIGKYVDPLGDELDLLVVEVKSLSKLNRARSALRNFAVNRLKTFNKHSSLVVFYSQEDGGADWRFSFIKIEEEAFQDVDGKIKLKQELTPARRASFLVGLHENSYTAAKQLVPLLEKESGKPLIEDIEEAFSVEQVSQEFFDQYRTLFQLLAAHLKTEKVFQTNTEEETDQLVTRFAKKLLGQIVFLYFLQKKGWLGVKENESWGTGSRTFLRDSFINTVRSGGNYYQDFLQYLFYEALACQREHQKDPGFYQRFKCRIPFLNGGLFEADYDWQNVVINIPDTLFHNETQNRAGDVGTGILDVFDRYNFTVKEDEPLDVEVAVDPEMLGKVFENMLEITERKGKGAFYTPREIVHYMCQESLICYLDDRLNNSSDQTDANGTVVPREDIATLIRRGHLALENDTRVLNTGKETKDYKFQLPLSIRNNAKEIDEALAQVKICDPAIGSGAFPVGMLHEIVNTRLAMAPHSHNQLSVYDLKRHAIAESIYGVDIDASAIDIARLRLWLSLVVDEDDYNQIEPLPNLDYKIVRGDSLLSIQAGIFNWKSLKAIETKKKEFFQTTDHEEKARLNRQIQALIGELTNESDRFDYQIYFSEVWHHNGGFDVIIGNPPYVQIQNFSNQPIQKLWEEENYETFARSGDLYCLFYEKGYRLLREGGVLAYITSNKWMLTAYGRKLREFFANKVQPLTLINFSSFQVFTTATIDTNILLFEKTSPHKPLQACLITPSFTRTTPLDAYLQENRIQMSNLSSDSWIVSTKEQEAIRQRMKQLGKPLSKWNISLVRGVVTGLNEAFILDGKKKNDLIKADPKSAEIIKPLLRGRDIKRYQVNFADLWLITTFPALNLDIDHYPAIREHLSSYGKKLLQTGEIIGKDESNRVIRSRKKTDHQWYETQDPIAYYKEFEREKIVWGNLGLSCQFALAEANVTVNSPSPLITGAERYLLGVLNSSLSDYYIRSLGVTRNGGYFEYQPRIVAKLPIPEITGALKKALTTLVNYRLNLTPENSPTQSAYWESIIDGLVYELYFHEELRAAGIEILPHIGDLIPITDQMELEAKQKVIKREYQRLHALEHPVRKNLARLEDFPVVKTVRATLQRN